MTLKPNDVTWYWMGGVLKGEWRQADYGTRAALRRMGYVAHDGRLAIGAPEGPPTAEELARVLSGAEHN